MAKSPESPINYGEVSKDLTGLLGKHDIDLPTLLRITQDLNEKGENKKLSETKFNLEQFYGVGNVYEPKYGFIRITDASGRSGFYDKAGKPISHSYVSAGDFESFEGKKRAPVWIESEHQPLGNPMMELRYIDQSGNIIPQSFELLLPLEVPDKKPGILCKDVQHPFPGCYSLWSEETLNFVKSPIKDLETNFEESKGQIDKAMERYRLMYKKRIIPHETKYTGDKGTVSGNIYLLADNSDTIHRIDALLTSRNPNIKTSYFYESIFEFTYEEKLNFLMYSSKKDLEDIRGIVLYPLADRYVDEGRFEGYYSLKISNTFFEDVRKKCIERGIPLLLIPICPTDSDLHSQIVTDFVNVAAGIET